MGINGRYGVSSPGSAGTAQRWHTSAFFTSTASLEEGAGETTLLSGDIPTANLSNTFLIKVSIAGFALNTFVAPNLVFRLLANGLELSTVNISAPSIDTESWYRAFSEVTPATDGLIELLWEFTSLTPGATMLADRVTMLIEEVTP